MPKRLVVVAHRFQLNILFSALTKLGVQLVIIVCLFPPLFVVAQAYPTASADSYVARIELHTVGELMGVLRRSNELFSEAQTFDMPVVTFILHGPEVRVFLKENYLNNQALVDLAAKLTALNFIEIKVCETWMGNQTVDVKRLLPFVGTVPFGPDEEQQLISKQGYSYF